MKIYVVVATEYSGDCLYPEKAFKSVKKAEKYEEYLEKRGYNETWVYAVELDNSKPKEE